MPREANGILLLAWCLWALCSGAELWLSPEARGWLLSQTLAGPSLLRFWVLFVLCMGTSWRKSWPGSPSAGSHPAGGMSLRPTERV